MYTYRQRGFAQCSDPEFISGPRDFGPGPGFRPGPRPHRGGGFRGTWGGRRARRGQLRESILRLLLEQPMNGYQIMTALAEKTMDAWQPSPGSIYPCLSQLEDEGLIVATTNDGQKVYTLTEAGKTSAEQVPEEPWSGTPTGLGDPQINAMMEQLAHLHRTVNYARQTATPEQMGAIATQLEATRKTLLAILAEAE